MSVQAMGWAFKVQTGSATAKSVLVALANYADEDGICWPSQARLARDTELTSRTVRDALAKLENMGLITRERRNDDDGYRTSDRIRLNASYGKEIPVGPDDPREKGSVRKEPTGKSPQKNGSHFPPNRQEPSPSSLRSEGPRKRARLPEDFQPTELDIAYGLKQGLTEEEVTHECEKFRTFWLADGGCKLNWHQALRNWFCKTIERRPRQVAYGSGGSTASTRFRATQQFIHSVQNLRRRDGGDEVDDTPLRF